MPCSLHVLGLPVRKLQIILNVQQCGFTPKSIILFS